MGTHTDQQRRGLARAVLRFAAHHMAAAGMEFAIAADFASSVASEALRGAGFAPWHVLDGYVKDLSAEELVRGNKTDDLVESG